MYAEHLPSFGIHGLQIQKWITTTWQKGKLQMNLIVFFFFFFQWDLEAPQPLSYKWLIYLEFPAQEWLAEWVSTGRSLQW